MKSPIADHPFLKIRNFLPALVILVFSLTALYSSARFFAVEEEVMSSVQGRALAIMQLEDAFHDFDAAVHRHYSPEGNETRATLGERLDKLIQNFVDLKEKMPLNAEQRKKESAIEDMFVYVSAAIDTSDRVEDGRVPLLVLRTLEDLHAAIELYENAQSQPYALTSEKLKRHHGQAFWSVFIMGLSGFVLIIVLIDKLTKLDRLDSQRRDSMTLLEQRMQAMESAFDGICISNDHGIITYVNEAALRCFGYKDKRDLLGKSWHRLYQKSQCEWFENEIVPILMEEGSWHGHTVGLKHDGTTFYQDVSLTLLQDGGMIRVVRDVSEMMQMEALSRRRLAAMEAAGDGIGIVDRQGNLNYMNHALMALHGIPEENALEYIGKRWEQLYNKKGAQHIREEVLPKIETEGYWRGESPIVRKTGEVIWAEMSLTRLPEGGFIGTARDISEKKKTERENAALQEQIFMAQKMEAVGRLAGGIAHDFNNILAAIMGYAEFLQEDLESEPKMQKMASSILEAGAQARHLVDQMLSFSRRKESVKDILDLRLSVEEAVSMLKASFPRSVEIKTHVETDEAMIEANPTQIGQVLMNLCVNAKDAMDDERGTLTIELSRIEADEDLFEDMLEDDLPEQSTTPAMRFHDLEPGHTCLELGALARGHEYVLLSVEDTGSGMSRQILERIFEPFFTTKAVDKGTGLGLANVHGIVAEHRGALIVDTMIGRGTRFDIFFPVADRQSGGNAKDENLGASAEPAGSGRILLVEDQEHVRDMMTLMIRRMGFDVDVAFDGVEALQSLRETESRYEMVITDHNMPRMTGMELSIHIGLEFQDLPVILVSGYSEQRMREDLESYPAIKAFLRKPVGRQKLAETIHDVLEGRREAA